MNDKEKEQVRNERELRELARLFENMQTHQKVIGAITIMNHRLIDHHKSACIKHPMFSFKDSYSLGLDRMDDVSQLIALSIELHKQGLLDVAE